MSQAQTSTGILVRRASLVAPPTVAITSNSVANPTHVTTTAPHLLATGDLVTIAGVTGSTPTINGQHKVTVLDATHFTIPVAVTVGGTGGTVLQDFATIAELTEVTPGGKTRNKIETSTHNEGTESHVLGILRQADPGFKANLVSTDQSHQDVNDDIDLNRKAVWQVAFPSGITRTGEGYVQTFTFDGAPVDGKQGVTVAWTWAGPVDEVFE